MWDFHVEDFMPERMALNLTPQNTPLAMDADVRFKAAGEQQSINTRLDPWVFMFSAGYRF